jgi:hypothetical protein
VAQAREAARPIGSSAELKNRLAEVFTGSAVVLPAHIDALLRLHAPLGDQRPVTCGAYVLSYLLPARGFDQRDGIRLAAEDYMAHLARVTVGAGESGYRFPVDSSADPVEQGTSPEGMARAVALATNGALASIPVPGRDLTGAPQLDSSRWDALIDLVLPSFAAGEVDAVFNYESDQLLAARDASYTLPALRRADASAMIPRDRWGVGHFAPLAAAWTRPSGERWMLLLNSFKERAFDGCEPQPAELVRRGVVREDGRGGGVLLVVRSVQAEGLIRKIERIGLEVRMWSNGSRPAGDWQWSRGR